MDITKTFEEHPDHLGYAYARHEDDENWHGPFDTRAITLEHLLAEDWDGCGLISACRAVHENDDDLDEDWAFICYGPREEIMPADPSMRLMTDALGFLLKLEIKVGKIESRGRHTTFENEDGAVSADATHKIDLAAGLTGGELIEVAAHEAYHLFYSVRKHITAGEETQAEVFGQLVKKLVEAVQN